MPDEKKNFFKKLNIFQTIQRYLHRADIHTQDDMPTDASVRTSPNSWSHSVMPSNWFWYSNEIYPAQRLRKRRYEDYAMMDDDGDIANALNIYADDATQTNLESGTTFDITSDNNDVKECIESLLFDTLQIDQQLWGLTRDLCKYGDAPFEIVLNSAQDSIVKMVPIPVEGFVRVEMNRSLKKFLFNPKLININSGTAATTEDDIIEYAPYEVAHFHLKSNEMRFYPYGRSVIESARKVWKQMKIMEDALVINRLVRAPERKVFFIEVGNMASAEADGFVERIKANYSKSKFFNPITGEIDEKASPINQSEDFFIPVRNGAGSKIESLPGANNMDQVNDIKLFRDKMLSAMGVPPQYMGRSSEGFEAKAGLSQQDIRFGRTIMRIQKAILAALYKVCYIQLYLKGFGIKDIKGLKLAITPPNALEEAMRLQAIQARLDVAGSAGGTDLFHNEWILKNIMLLSDDEIKVIMKKKKLQDSAFGAAAGAAGAPGGGGMPGGMPSGAPRPTGENPEDASDFEKFVADPEADDGKIPQHGRVEVAGKEYFEDMIAESEIPKINKYKYKASNFVHLVNEGQFDGLIDFTKVDQENKQVLTEMQHSEKVKLYDMVENLEQTDGGNSNEAKES